MQKLREIKDGDTVTLKALVIAAGAHTLKLRVNQAPDFYVHRSSTAIVAVDDPPLKVGDTVFYKGGSSRGYTLLHIHQEPGDDRIWGVVAYKGDIPESKYLSDLRIRR